jgi:dolichol-phosphate mannosyltransferase
VSRFVRFNIVGALGLAVQLAVLAGLDRAGWPLVPATLTAVEVAVLHNFFWHERWTWADRRPGRRVDRLLRFHASNG